MTTSELSPDPIMENYKQWYQKYLLVEPNKLYKDSELLKAVESDELDLDLVEQRIQQSIPTAPLTNGFCAKCQETFDNWPTLGSSSSRTHESTPADFPDDKGWETAVARPCSTFEIEGATRAGCKFCTFLLQDLKDTEMLETFRKVEIRLHYLGEDAKPSLSIQNWGNSPLQLLWLNLPGKVCTSCNAGMALEVKFHGSFLPEEADCYDEPLDVFAVTKKWMTICLKEHELCQNDEGISPTRLVCVASEPPRLVLSSELTKRPQYVTLSHSWGGHDVIKLTTENLDSFLEALPIDILPQTFKDAIEITRRMGIDYLWVDSLCIIQNSEADWEFESGMMTSVYGESLCTIAAASARNSTEGCFRKLPNYSGGLRARITDGGRKRVQDFRSGEVYERSTWKTHLGTRAWALQEKMLPPRTIHYGERGAFWECRTSIASEYLPDGFPKQLVRPLVRRKGKFEWLWPQIIQLYSSANLTFGKDKLPALSGVARLGYNETGDDYLAGLWKEQLEEQLCWRRFQSEPMDKRPAWRAPTWSWASIDGGVAWFPRQGRLENQYAHVVGASTTKRGADPFGQITIGVVRIACSGLVVGHLAKSKKPSHQDAIGNNIILKLSGDEVQEYSINLDCLEDAKLGDNEPVYLLPILGGRTGCSSRKIGEEPVYETMVEGVVLRVTGGKKGEFARVGSFDYYVGKMYGFKESRKDELYEPFLKLLGEQDKAAAERVCAEVVEDSEHPNHRYVVTII